jgi:hypothetical protein
MLWDQCQGVGMYAQVQNQKASCGKHHAPSSYLQQGDDLLYLNNLHRRITKNLQNNSTNNLLQMKHRARGPADK